MKAFREHCTVLVAYALLTAVLTYPLVFQFSTHLPGDGSETNLHVWTLWWFKKAIVDLRANPFWTDYLFYPEGLSLVFHTLVPFNGLLGLPLQYMIGLVASFNLLVVFAFVLSGYGTYLLIRYLLAERKAAFIGGMIFAFCPYKFAHLLGHFHLVSTEWLPFYALTLLKLTEPGPPAGVRLHLRCAVFLLLIALCDYYYLFYALIFMALHAAYKTWAHGFQAFRDRDCRSLRTVLGLFLIGFAPLLAMAAIDLLREGHQLIASGGDAAIFQADLLSFVIPSPFHPLLGPLAKPLASRFQGNPAEGTVFTGYLPLVLGLLAVVRLRSTEPWVRFWSLALLVFFVLSLGPFPRILGHGIRSIPLPYQFIMRTPFLNNLRVPSRFDIMLMLCLAVLAAYSCRDLLARFQGECARACAFAGAALVITLEYLAIPFPTFAAIVPGIYGQIGKDPGEFTVLEVPLGRSSGTSWSIGKVSASSPLYQTAHGKKLFGGYNIARVREPRIRALGAHPVLRKVLDLQEGRATGSPSGDRDLRRIDNELEALGVRYVIIHPPFHRSPVREYVEAVFPVEKISDGDGVVAFRIRARAEERHPVSPGKAR